MKVASRILFAIASTLAGVFLGVTWLAPCALSFYAAAKAPKVTRIVPVDVSDLSVSTQPGQRLSYFGYEFEVPWTDLDVAQNQFYPKGKPDPNRVVLSFRSGLRLMVTAIPPHEWINGVSSEMKTSPQQLESAFGPEVTRSDYTFVRAMYEFTPASMRHWNPSQQDSSRQQIFLILKSIAPLRSAETGIFNVQNEHFKGFQQGDPRAAISTLAVTLYSEAGSIEFIFSQPENRRPLAITQPEINTVIQSLRNVAQN